VTLLIVGRPRAATEASKLRKLLANREADNQMDTAFKLIEGPNWLRVTFSRFT
jgi:hypothetical protein